MAIGKELQSRKQAFNIKHGIDPKKCRVHERALGRPVQKEGANRNRSVAIETLVADYWRQFDWDPKTGKPVTTVRKKNANENRNPESHTTLQPQ